MTTFGEALTQRLPLGRLVPGKVGDGFESALVPKVACGKRGCAGLVAQVEVWEDVLHRVRFRAGFHNNRGVFELTRRALQQWGDAKRAGVPWERFTYTARRLQLPHRLSYDGEWQSGTWSPDNVTALLETFVFRCPKCHLLYRATVRRDCVPDCEVCEISG